MEAGPAKPWNGPGPTGTVVGWYAQDQRGIKTLIQTAASMMVTESVPRKAEYPTGVNGAMKGHEMLTSTLMLGKIIETEKRFSLFGLVLSMLFSMV